MAGPPTRTQPSRPNKRKADDPPVHCRKCETSHSPYQGCSLSTFRQKAKASASESDADEDEHVNAGVDEDDDEEDIQLPPAAKKSKKSSVRGGGKKKRKNVEDEVVDICECEGMNHKIKAECEREQLRKTHVEVSFCASLTSNESITVIVGGQSFTACKVLLCLHSDYFREITTSDKASSGNESAKIESNIQHTIPSDFEISPFQFSLFLCWVEHGYFIDRLLSISQNESDIELEHLWFAGERLGSPGFQNYIMERLRISDPVQSGQWPTFDQARTVYQLTSELPMTGQLHMLQNFVAEAIAANNPFERYEQSSDEYWEWKRLYEENSTIGIDVLLAGSKRWIESKPWDDEHRYRYLLPHDHEVRWEDIILEARTQDEVALAEGKGCVRTDLESAHLKREQHMVGGINNVDDEVGH